ncbi:Maf1-domain-containing protein [Aulographum hederae CBS 113979]|uniref:Repressor of RNA polymerase III transcription MAF1 n=1 Tax=Aulographum hederae CBS 113979 TaxID=1176131 RepID=A0A6G1GQQ9_9PEZI|nr:Maf1-domain-containing protein [Aulographum hederae CBS 113979]
MKYLPTRDFEDVTSALTFDTTDCHVVGGCELYTTKAGKADRRLHSRIEASLVAHQRQTMTATARLTPEEVLEFSAFLEEKTRSSFGSLDAASNRRTFSYLIATLNASHPDYDFANVPRPQDFHGVHYRRVMSAVDNAIYSIRPRPAGALLAVSSNWANAVLPAGAQTPGGSVTWGPRMWQLINDRMDMKRCQVYHWKPEEDPFEEEEPAVLNIHFFLYNKTLKRVCYLYVRGVSVLTHLPMVTPMTPMTPKRKASLWSLGSVGATKRARYWLGDKVDNQSVEGGLPDEDDEEDDGTHEVMGRNCVQEQEQERYPVI